MRLKQCVPLILVCLFVASTAAADSLERLIRSPDFEQLEGKSRVGLLYKQAGPNYLGLMHSAGGATIGMLSAWLGDGLQNFNAKDGWSTYTYRFIVYQRSFVSENDADLSIDLNLYIPQISSVVAAKNGLLSELSELEPPILKVESSEEFELSWGKVKIYSTRDTHECLLVSKLARESVLTLKTASCENKTVLLKFYRSLGIQRFNQKMNS